MHLIDPDLRILLSEGDRMRAHGYDPAQLDGRLLEEVLPADAFARLAPEYRAALAGERRSFDWDTSDGSATYWVQIAPLRDEVGRVIGAMALSRDITERKQAEIALADRARELERSNAELEQFAYIASHDLSEPLRMVSSYLQLLRRRYHGRLDGDADAFIDYAVDGAGRMRDLIDGLLSYSRAGRGERPQARVETGAVVARVVERAAGPGGRPRGALRCRGSAHGARRRAAARAVVPESDRQRDQVRARGPDARGARDGRARRARLALRVADNGIGLDPAHADRIFRMFQRLHTRDDYPGTGIGLAIAKKVVERHGGDIWAEPARGRRHDFWFTLPDAGKAPA